MNALRSSSGSPASMSGIMRSISPKIAFSCVRASDAPHAVMRPAATEAKMPVRIAGQIQLPGPLEHVVITIPRVVEENDLLPGRERLAVDLDLPRGRAPERHHRGSPADELLDGVR